MLNKIRIKNTKEILKERNKKGRVVNCLFESGRNITMGELNKLDTEIQCLTCNQWKPVSLYSGRIDNPFNCQSCNCSGDNNPFYGKKHSVESKNKMSNSTNHHGENNPFYGKKHSVETKQTLSEWMSGRYVGDKNAFYGKTHTNETRKILSEKSREYALANLDKMSEMGIKSVQLSAKGRKTKPEKLTEDRLIDMGFNFKYNKIIKGIGQFDFIIDNDILLEVHGDYWHANPKIYGEGKRQLSERQEYKIKRDEEKRNAVEKLGYTIYYIWEYDIKNDNYGVLNDIKISRDRDTNK